jgi:hypothetical protein
VDFIHFDDICCQFSCCEEKFSWTKYCKSLHYLIPSASWQCHVLLLL